MTQDELMDTLLDISSESVLSVSFSFFLSLSLPPISFLSFLSVSTPISLLETVLISPSAWCGWQGCSQRSCFPVWAVVVMACCLEELQSQCWSDKSRMTQGWSSVVLCLSCLVCSNMFQAMGFKYNSFSQKIPFPKNLSAKYIFLSNILIVVISFWSCFINRYISYTM